jgi:hypothetical protein
LCAITAESHASVHDIQSKTAATHGERGGASH